MALLATLAFATTAQDDATSLQGCTFTTAPDEFLARESKARQDVFQRSTQLGRMFGRNTSRLVNPAQVTRNNFIDEEIFDRLQKENVSSAPLSSDEEFLRRIYLDLTGRIPSAQEVREFLADGGEGKRSRVIDRLLFMPEFTDKWTLWLGDILQNTRATSVGQTSSQTEGRNRMYEWIRELVDRNASLRELATQAVTANGNNYERGSGAVNYPLRSRTSMGPIQDSYDTMLSRTASLFLGVGHYDCLLCHDGRGHLDALSAFGRATTRQQAQRMAAFFSRTTWAGFNNAADPTNFLVNSTYVRDNPTGQYDLNTTFGNRPNRVAIGTGATRIANYTPVYIDGRTPATASGTNWREAFAGFMVSDPMFARNLANRIWKQMFNLALAEPVDGLDPLRLNPAVKPPAGWDYQASHPQLLEKLATALAESDFNLRAFVKLLAESNAYQLSSRYDGQWSIEYVPLFARHYARRIDAEEVHDAIVKATGNIPRYTIQGFTDQVSWAMQFPEPNEPSNNGAAVTFLNSFQRGNRDTSFRSQAGSIQMSLALMNSAVVTDRVRLANSPYLTAIARDTNNANVAADMFLTFLSRLPTEYERGVALKRLAGPFTSAYTRNNAIEDLAWVLINKVDFIFSY